MAESVGTVKFSCICMAMNVTHTRNLCQRLLQAQQGQVLSFAMETVFVVFYLHS